MAPAEQPLKKRKLYDFPPPSPPKPMSPPPPRPQPLQPPTPPPLSQEEILRRRRSLEELRDVFECYKKIKFCIDRKDKSLVPELEQAYLSLIAASRGGASVKRLVAEYVPRYAAYCPTALEAAARVVLNMHSWCFSLISREEDSDGIAFEIAKACILGLCDICQASASEASTSVVIQQICSVVFRDVLTFLVLSFEGKDIFQILDQRVLKIYDVAESFSDFWSEILNENDSILSKLSKFRALSFLRIFFRFPKNALAACFELFESGTEGTRTGNCFLHQLTIELSNSGDHHLHEGCDEESFIDSSGKNCDKEPSIDACPPSGGNSSSNSTSVISKNCLLGLVVLKDTSFKSWIVSRYRMLSDSVSPEVVSNVTSVLEGVFESFMLQVKAEDKRMDVSGRDCPEQHSGISEKSKSAMKCGIDALDGESKSMDLHYTEHGDLSNTPYLPSELLSRQSFSPRSRTPRDLRNNSFNGRIHAAQIEMSPVPIMDLTSPALGSSTEAANSPFESPNQNIPLSSSRSHGIWYTDGDPAALDIFPASKKLWLGSLGPDASEMLIRFQFDKFGPIEQLYYFPFKGFATIEYRNIMDAIKAREVMRGCSPWGASLRIKFLDTGLGTRGAINGTSVGSSCHVYIGNILSTWAKDEIIHEVNKVLHKSPRMVVDLSSEGALLMEFDSPEEATISIAHLRRRREENRKFLPPLPNVGSPNAMMHVEGARSASVHVDTRNSFCSATMIRSPNAQTLLEKPSESYWTAGTSGLSSLLLQLRTKYNISHPHGSFENHPPGTPMHLKERESTNTLRINIPNISPSSITDDELLAVFNLAMDKTGSVIQLSRTNMPTGSYWFVECSSRDAAQTILNNLRDCPGIFFQIEFSSPAKSHRESPKVRPGSSSIDLITSPRINQENCGTMKSNLHAFQSTWTGGGIVEIGRTGASEQSWMYRKPESGMHPGHGGIASVSAQAPGPSCAPPQPVQASTFVRPVHAHPNSLWDARGLGHHLPPKPTLPANAHTNLRGPPFLPASVTPLAQIQGSFMPPFSQRFPLPVIPPPLSSLPPPPSNVPPSLPPQSDFQPPLPSFHPFTTHHPEMLPPLPPMPPPPPPPPPPSQPPAFPPPPSSPPPLPPSISIETESSRLSLHYPWQGKLSKSGVYYCTIHAERVDSNICNYSNAIAEPAEWPAKLDMTKRTDLRHVKSTFGSTPPHRREICWLLPSSHGDHKGFQDFVSYLRQRDCAGVIKLPAAKFMWARLLFILPYSPEYCSMLSIPPNNSLCLIGLILPKDANSELA